MLNLFPKFTERKETKRHVSISQSLNPRVALIFTLSLAFLSSDSTFMCAISLLLSTESTTKFGGKT